MATTHIVRLLLSFSLFQHVLCIQKFVVKEGEHIQLECPNSKCHCSVGFKPRLWTIGLTAYARPCYRLGKETTSSLPSNVKIDSSTFTLQITSFSEENEGRYRCSCDTYFREYKLDLYEEEASWFTWLMVILGVLGAIFLFYCMYRCVIRMSKEEESERRRAIVQFQQPQQDVSIPGSSSEINLAITRQQHVFIIEDESGEKHLAGVEVTGMQIEDNEIAFEHMQAELKFIV